MHLFVKPNEQRRNLFRLCHGEKRCMNMNDSTSQAQPRTIQHSTLNTQHSELRYSAIHLSLGDREEHCRNQRMKRIGDCVRAEYDLLCKQLSPTAVTLRWHEGGHFGAEAERTAEAFAWCMAHL